MSKQPNILFILTDDQGAWSLGCAGNQELKTPHLDQLAASGIRFENFFCVSPVCSPARASIYTGKIPSQHGVHDWLAKGHLSDSHLSADLTKHFQEDDPPYEYLWPKNQLMGDQGISYLSNHTTFTDVLAQNGYACGLSGKWHIGDSFTPQAGFTFWRTTAMGGENYYHPLVLEDHEVRMKDGVYVTDYITDNALNFLRSRNEDQPFFLAVHYTAPHSPWAAPCHPEEYIQMYDQCPFDSIPNLPPHPWCAEANQTRAEWDQKPHPGVRFIHAQYAPIREEWQQYRRESLRGYFAAVTAMDAAVGRLLKELDDQGLRDNTLVVFTSDNGSNMGHHGIFGKGNGTYPQNMYDTSVKVPGIFSFPGVIPPNQVTSAMASHYDLYETILDMAGVPCPQDSALPGHSFAPILRGEDACASDAVIVFDEYGPTRMIRTQEWKYVCRLPQGPDELYDLVNDPDEYHNLIDDPQQQDRISALRSQLDTWFQNYVDPALDGSKEDVRGKGQLDSHHFVH
nr:sulfatase-like hydrolase/transferase [uncultured Dysosmobacter sp.]